MMLEWLSIQPSNNVACFQWTVFMRKTIYVRLSRANDFLLLIQIMRIKLRSGKPNFKPYQTPTCMYYSPPFTFEWYNVSITCFHKYIIFLFPTFADYFKSLIFQSYYKANTSSFLRYKFLYTIIYCKKYNTLGLLVSDSGTPWKFIFFPLLVVTLIYNSIYFHFL